MGAIGRYLVLEDIKDMDREAAMSVSDTGIYNPLMRERISDHMIHGAYRWLAALSAAAFTLGIYRYILYDHSADMLEACGVSLGAAAACHLISLGMKKLRESELGQLREQVCAYQMHLARVEDAFW